MSWTTPRTWVTGETLTSTLYNAQFRDNLAMLDPVANIGAALPGSPSDGQVFNLIVDVGNGVVWTMKWNQTATKWLFIGGAPLYGEALAVDTTSSGSYTDLAGGANPTIALPRNGDYMVTISAHVIAVASGSANAFMTAACTGLSAADNNAWWGEIDDAFGGDTLVDLSGQLTFRAQGLTASTLAAKYRVDGNTGSFSRRRISAIPIRLT